jgi:group I intron endonuclease
MTKIYLVTNCYGDSNKVYIGKTKNCRFKDHQEKYGEFIEYCYIDEVNSLSYNDWEPLETYWIEQFRQWGFEIVNIRKKGGSGPEFQTKEAKIKLSLSLTGIKHKPHKKHKSWKCVSPRIKGSNHYLYGKKQTQEHIQKRSKKRPEGTGKKISEKLKGKKHTQETKSKISQKNSVAVIQLDKMGNFIKEWNSMSEVERILGLSKRNISNTCSGRQSTSGGFIWKYKFS